MHELLSTLSEILGPEAVLSGIALDGRAAGIWSNEPLQALAIVRPESTEEVAAVLKVCHAAKQSVVPVGGMTGLAGAHKTGANDIALSLERMTAIESVDTRSRKMTVQAGAILQKIQEQAQQADLMFPLDLGARASCTIGGNIATNAGGVRVIRYGMTRALILGLEAVLADGTVISSMSGLMKNNTGYDLSQLFIGAEGTLGVVTRAVLRLYEAPKAVETALLAVPSWDAVMTLLRRFDSALSGGLVAFEVMWRDYYDLNTGPYSELNSPLSESTPFYILIDVFVNETESGREAIETLLMESIERGDIVDAVIAQSETQRLKIWQIREDFEPEQKRFKQSFGFDVSLNIEDMDGYVEGIRQQL
jgi:FAD/FMN-containing dehydrogenase